MRSPLLRLAAGLLLLAGCGKKKDGPTYDTRGAIEKHSPVSDVFAVAETPGASVRTN
ncbi:MAG: hypothetical protein H7099_15265 [Gemmatimonadaceae bacterium]|nr:hypothetical protein [Gemmatimonadaceae bacterium]